MDCDHRVRVIIRNGHSHFPGRVDSDYFSSAFAIFLISRNYVAILTWCHSSLIARAEKLSNYIY